MADDREKRAPRGSVQVGPCHRREEPVRGGQFLVFSLEGHVIDRKSSQNGRGWAEGYAHTLNATDRHGVVYRSQRDRPHEPGIRDGGVTETLRAQRHQAIPVIATHVVSAEPIRTTEPRPER